MISGNPFYDPFTLLTSTPFCGHEFCNFTMLCEDKVLILFVLRVMPGHLTGAASLCICGNCSVMVLYVRNKAFEIKKLSYNFKAL